MIVNLSEYAASIVNLTQHEASFEQVAQGVFNLGADDRASLQALLTFNSLPSEEEIFARAKKIAEMAAFSADIRPESAMIAGAPYLMAPLERALRTVGIKPVYAFSVRESVEQPQPDGSVIKTGVFRHIGFV